jgi:Holliday junction resolvasome RuvABC DNA-binding subunit
MPSSFRTPDSDTEIVSRHEIISALINLGFKRQNAEMAFDKSIRTVEESSNFEIVLKQCLNYLSGGLTL